MVVIWANIALPAMASILGNQQLHIDFTKPAEAKKLVRWSDPAAFNCTTDGFGWDGEVKASRDGWLETEPLAIGTAWRPPQSATLQVKLRTNYPAVVSPRPDSKIFYVPALYVRHSPDRSHWSEWQPLAIEEDPRQPGSVRYTGIIGVPGRSAAAYHQKLQVWSRRDDVAWGSDEHEFCEQLIRDEPEFFQNHRPFVGYVQFLIEGSFKGGQRLTHFEADAQWGVGGIHMLPKQPRADRRADSQAAWGFRGGPAAQGDKP